MIDERFVLVAALFNVYGSASYALSTIRGKTKPNRVTWFLWALAPLIAFAAQLQNGVGWAALMTFMVGFGPALVLAASFVNKQATWQITRFDTTCGVLSLTALVLWVITGSGLLAILLSIAADFLAGIPTLRKAWSFPETENATVFLNGLISAGITLLTIRTWSFSHYAFALYIATFCAVMYVLVRYKPQK